MLDILQHGFTGSAPELRYTPSGDPVANFRVGSTDRWVDQDTGEEKERTTWISWECWGKSGENLAKIVKKGAQVLITGTIRNDSWDDPRTGEKRYKDRYVVGRWKLLDRKPREDAGPADEHVQSEGTSGGVEPAGDATPAHAGSEKGAGKKSKKAPAAVCGPDGKPF
jgi:single-strand DNA-binding protein